MSKEQIKNTKNVFDEFTGKYELSKTLRFELKPVGKTTDLLKQNQVFEKDKFIDDNYHKIKYYFDILHREFIYGALRGVSFPAALYENYYNAVQRLKAAKKEEKKNEKKKLREIEDELREKVVERFNDTAKIWKKDLTAKSIELKQDNTEVLFEEAILAVLKQRFPNPPSDDPNAPAIMFTHPATGEEKNLFDSFKGFFTYFSNFNNTKRNLYSKEEQDTAVANRAINENLRKFVENIFQFNERKNDYLQAGLTKEERQIFDLMFCNQCFAQNGIDKYNRIIGGFVTESGEKVKGINEKINLYNQQYKDKKLWQFAQLFKQILSKKDKKERFAEITDDAKVFTTLEEFLALNDGKLTNAKILMESFFKNNGLYDLEKVYIKGGALNTISQKWFNNWAVIGNLFQSGSKKKNKKSNEENGEAIKLPDFVSVAQLKQVLESRSIPENENFVAAKDIFRADYKNIYEKTTNYYEIFLKIWGKEWQDCIEQYAGGKREVEIMVKKEGLYRKESEEQIAKIKSCCDAALAVFQMMKYFALEKGRKKIEPDNGVDAAFYNSFNEYYQDYPVPVYYKEFRDYLTKKAHLGRLLFPAFNGKNEQRHPLSKRRLDGAEKIKLNFENGMLLSGWDKNKESQYYGVLFRDGAKFLLGIMTKEYHDLFIDQQKFSAEISPNNFTKVEYRQLNNIFRQLPRIAFAESNRELYGVTNELDEIRDEFKKFQDVRKKDKKLRFDKKKLDKLIDLYKKVLRVSYSADFNFGDTLDREYNFINDFFSAVERKTYALKFIPVNQEYIDGIVSEGKMFLFEITNKDFKKQRPSADNLHTLYFKALFDAKNLASPILKLSGGAEVFFRPRNEYLGKKKDKKGREVADHKRYGEDKVFLHIPIVLNMGVGGDFGFNSRINEFIAQDKKVKKIKIIGVDRGEKHLAYFALIDQDGKLLKCGDMDGMLPNGETYLKKLEDRAVERGEARREWKTIENIKELKNGYVSWVVRHLADMMLKENAVLVFEDLNIGFKRGRQKIEQQVYQKLELAIVRKLNYLVQKDALDGTPGHHLKAYQLTPQVHTPQDIGKQCGVVFYVSPGYTSLTCPECGYRKNISFNFENIQKARDTIQRTNLHMTYKDGTFCISYKSFDEKGRPKDTVEVSSNVKRVRWHKKGTEYAKEKENPDIQGEKIMEDSKSGVVKEYDMTVVLKHFFNENGIEYAKQTLSALELVVPESADYYRRLFWFLNLLLRSRNSVSGTDTDYIQCPRCLFHSDNDFQGHKYNGDANGAYNIARKGLLALRKIQEASDPAAVKWGDLRIDVSNWDKFVQKQWNNTSKSPK